MSANLQTTAVS